MAVTYLLTKVRYRAARAAKNMVKNQVITNFGDKMGDNVGDNIIELLNLVTDFSLYSVTNEVIIKFGDEYGDKFDDKFGDKLGDHQIG